MSAQDITDIGQWVFIVIIGIIAIRKARTGPQGLRGEPGRDGRDFAPAVKPYAHRKSPKPMSDFDQGRK